MSNMNALLVGCRSLPSPRLDARLYDGCESSLPLGSNVVDDASLTDLG